MRPLAVIEAKGPVEDLGKAREEVTKAYGDAFVKAGFRPLAIAIAGTSEDDFELEVLKRHGQKWLPITYEGTPITWVPNPEDLRRIAVPKGPLELRPTVPPPEVLASRGEEINRLLRESGIKDEFRPAVIGAIMLALWSSRGEIRKSTEFILHDINTACEAAFLGAEKPDLAQSLRVDEANADLAKNARRICSILERLNVAVLTAEHDYLGQLYETFFRYTGGNTIGQYFTPRHITEMMADLCEVGKDDKVIDPACGTGGFLVAAMTRILKHHSLTRAQVARLVKRRLIGFEKEPITASLCVANMILRGDGSSGVLKGDLFTSASFPSGKASVCLMNPPFPHKKTDVPPEQFVDRALEALRRRGRMAVVLPTSLLVKKDKGGWRESILKSNTLLGVCQLPGELFQPYASATTSVVLLEKGVPHSEKKRTPFVRIHRDGLTLKKGIRVLRRDGQNQIPAAIDAVLNRVQTKGFSGVASISGRDEWAVGAYIESEVPSTDDLQYAVDILIRRLSSFYVRFAPDVATQRRAILDRELEVAPYRELISEARKANAEALLSESGTIGEAFDIFYGMKELHSRDGIPPGRSLVVSPTEEYNGCYGWLQFQPLIQPPFLTVAQTGSIGEAFVQLEPCAVNDDCLVLLPRKRMSLARLVIAAATLHLEKWRFSYGRKLTPSRICNFPFVQSKPLEAWVRSRLRKLLAICEDAVSVYS